MSDNVLLGVIWSVMGALGLAGAALGWWYGTVSFYRRAIGEAYVPIEMRRGQRMRRHLERVFWTLFGAAGGVLVSVVAIIGLAR